MIELAVIVTIASSAFGHNYGWSQGHSSSYAYQHDYAWQWHANYEQTIPPQHYYWHNNQQSNYHQNIQPNWSHENFQNIPTNQQNWNHENYQSIPNQWSNQNQPNINNYPTNQQNWNHENYQNIPNQWSNQNQPNINNYPTNQQNLNHENYQNIPNQWSNQNQPNINNYPSQNPSLSNGNNNRQEQPSQQLNTAEVFANDRAADSNQQALQGAPMYNETHNPCTREIERPDFKKPGRRISEEKCLEYIWLIKFREDTKTKNTECTQYRREVLHIFEYPFIGGRNTKPGEIPHMVALGWKAVKDGYIFKCGASLISPKFAVTAAHCSRTARDPKLASQVPEIVRYGAKNLAKISKDEFDYPRDVKITKITTHPNYKSPKQYFDIALIEVEKEIKFEKDVMPACLWTSRSVGNLGSAVSSSGWGVTEIGGKNTTTELQVGDLDVIDDMYCDQLLRPKCNRYWCGLQDHQMCAGKLAGGVDACQGDSGGPLQSRINLDPRLKEKMYYLLGLTSVGFGCARENTPGIYTRISSFLDWIEPIVWPNGS